ncbi:MAG: DNA primase, partial [Candidatus Omnitrophica bacterium]|nr:DNA primase [Candidatus Omnitrophota bacterium]
MAYIPENIIEDILNRTDIVELISSYIPLKRAGRNFKALCPFHQEKTPSFMVSPQKQIYHCFGCQTGGNAISFLMHYEHLSFPEAIELLARKAGINIPKLEISKKEQSYLVYYKINELACNFYQNNLYSNSGREALSYLKSRGIKESTQKQFRLGWALSKWDALTDYLRQKNISVSLLEKLGFVLSKEDGGYYDRFRNRIIFPIFDIKSRVIGFGARLLPKEEISESEQAKYINSPQTPIYTKGEHLYGLNFAKERIIKEDFIIVVEGYFDCIIPYQEGLENIVASLGTAFTEEQAHQIKRYTQNVVMVYDGDSAGELATLRSLDIFLEKELEVRVVGLPKGFDPDLYVRQYGIESFKNLILNSKNLFDYKLEILKSRYDINEPKGKLKISEEILPTIDKFSSPVLKATYIKRLAEELGVNEETLISEMKRFKEKNKTSYLRQVGLSSYNKLDIHPTEKLLIKLMLEEEEIIKRLMQTVSPADFEDERT